jgi:Tat protein secretion system quality control protein TatD with DNase activity
LISSLSQYDTEMKVVEMGAYNAAVDAAQTTKDPYNIHLEGVVNVWCETAELLHGLTDEHTVWLQQPLVNGAFGLHPHNAKDWSEELEKSMRQLLSHKKCVALGECGLVL